MHPTVRLAVLSAAAMSVPLLGRAQFNITTAVTTPQTLNNAAGTVATNGSILIASGTGVPVTLTGVSTLTNSGVIQQWGTGRALNNGTAGGTLTVVNSSNAVITAVAQDAFKTANSTVLVDNAGTMLATNGQTLDLRDITSRSNVVVNRAGGSLLATGEDAVRPGFNGIVTNAGLIRATPVFNPATTNVSGSDGIDIGANLGVRIENSGTIEGRHGITGGATLYSLTVNNHSNGVLRGVNGGGVNIDGLAATATTYVNNAVGGSIEGRVNNVSVNGDADGIDIDGVLVLNNAGDVTGFGAKGVDSGGSPNNADGIAAGGGSIVNTATGRIIGSSLVADAPTGDTTREGHGILIDNGSGGSGFAVTTIDNAGLIEGRGGYGIKLVGTFDDLVHNRTGANLSGTDTPGGAPLAVLQTGAGNDTVTNSGAITHAGGNTATAINTEDGNDTIVIAGGAASVTGGINGGAGTDSLTFALGASNTFTHGGSISHIENLNAASGRTVLNGNATITGGATVGAGADLRINGTLSALSLGVHGTLGGTGVIQAATTLEAGSTLAAGNSVGTLEFQFDLSLVNAILGGDGNLQFELGPASHDQVHLTAGILSIGFGLLNFDDFTFSGVGVTNGTYTLFSTTNAINGSLGANLTGLIGGRSATLALAQGSSDVVVNIVPEPASGLALLLTAGAGCLRRRRPARRG